MSAEKYLATIRQINLEKKVLVEVKLVTCSIHTAKKCITTAAATAAAAAAVVAAATVAATANKRCKKREPS